VVLSTSNAPNEISDAYSLGAYDFVTKPGTFQEYLYIMRDLRQAWMKLTKTVVGLKPPPSYMSSGFALATN